jgi:uncharacterized protein (TIGR03437 family)
VVSIKAAVPALNLSGTAQQTVGLQDKQALPIVSGAPASAASLAQGPLAPGELFMVQGSSLADGTATAGSSPQDELAGASLLIGGRIAPLVYADSNRVVGLVPTDLPVNTQQQLVVKRGVNLGLPVPVILATAHPAVFTPDGSGQGQGLVYHLDEAGVATTLADASTPARPGEAVAIYCGGLGPLDALEAPVSVRIGGQPAEVRSANLLQPELAPPGWPPPGPGGSVLSGSSGVYQVVAVVPAAVSAGDVPVIVTSASQDSQPGITLRVSGDSAAPSRAPVRQR